METSGVSSMLQDAVVAAGLLALLLIALEVGFRFGMRSASRADIP
jgi:hypothetical protein